MSPPCAPTSAWALAPTASTPPTRRRPQQAEGKAQAAVAPAADCSPHVHRLGILVRRHQRIVSRWPGNVSCNDVLAATARVEKTSESEIGEAREGLQDA